MIRHNLLRNGVLHKQFPIVRFNMKPINLIVLSICLALATAATITNVSVNLQNQKFRRSARIIGGKTASKGQFPYFSPILQCDRLDYYCGGVILSKRYVLSEGNCLNRIPIYPPTVCLGVGMIDRKKDGPLIRMKIWKEYRKHPQEVRYSLVMFKTIYNDIIFNDFVQPIALPTERLPNGENTKVVTMGFGASTPHVNMYSVFDFYSLCDVHCTNLYHAVSFLRRFSSSVTFFGFSK